MRKTWLMIGIIIVLTITCVNINLGRFMDAHAVEKAKKPAPAPPSSVSERKGSMASKAVAAPAPAAKKVEEIIPSDLIDTEVLYKIIGEPASSAAISSNGKYFAAGSQSNLYILEAENWEYLAKPKNSHGSDDDVSFSTNDKYLVRANWAGSQVLEMGSWKILFDFPHWFANHKVTLSPSNRFLVTSSGYNHYGGLFIHEVNTWKKLFEKGYRDDINAIAFSPNEKYLSVGGESGIRIYEIGSWKELVHIMDKNEMRSITFSPDCRYLVSGENNGISIIDTETWQVVSKISLMVGNIEYIAFSPDGRYFLSASSNKTTSIFEVDSWRHIKSINNFKLLSSDGKWLVGNQGNNVVAIEKSRLTAYFLNKDLTNLGFKQQALDFTSHFEGIKGDYQKNLKIIIAEAEETFKKLGGPQKDEFETESEYKARLANRETKIKEIKNRFEEKNLSLRREGANRRVQLVEKYEKELNKLLIASRKPIKNLHVILGNYIPDAETFSITITSAGVESLNDIVKVPRTNARNLKESIDKYQVIGEVQLDRTGTKKLVNIAINNPDTGETYYLAKTATGQDGQVALLPPNLSASIKFEEPSGTMALNAEETGKLVIRIKNDGKGSAYQVIARPIPAEPISDLSYEAEKFIPEIGPGTEQEIIFPLKAGLDLPTKQVQFNVGFEEKNGLPPNPVKITFQTRAVLKPDLQIVDYAIDNAAKDGIIKPEEVVKMTFRVQNKGQGTGRNVVAKVALGNNVFPALNMPLAHKLGELKPNAVKEFTIAFYANQRVRDKLPLKVDLVEDRKRFNAEKQYALSMGVKEKTVFETVVSAKDMQAVQITDLEVSSDLEQDIPSTGVINKNAVAVVIGNYDYKKVQKVSFARRDAVVMKEYLVKTFGYDPGNIIFLPDASLSDMLNALGSAGAAKRSKLSSYLRPGSEIFVYYTGHGAPGLQDKKGYLVPIDADPNNIETTGYSLETLYRNLESLNASKLTVVIDACFSGDSQAGMLLKDASPIMVQAKSDKLNAGTVITSSSGDQISSWYPEKKHSLFTYFFLKGIKDKAARKEPVTIQNLKVYVTDEVDRMSKRLYNRIQTPGFEGNLEERLID